MKKVLITLAIVAVAFVGYICYAYEYVTFVSYDYDIWNNKVVESKSAYIVRRSDDIVIKDLGSVDTYYNNGSTIVTRY